MSDLIELMNPYVSAGDERLRRWRLVLGQTEDEAGTGPNAATGGDAETQPSPALSDGDQSLDEALEAIYGEGRGGDLSDSAPDVARRLGDIRRYFPEPMVAVIQADVVKRLTVRQLVQSPELLAAVEPDPALAASLLSLRKVIPAQTEETARQVVAQVVRDLLQRLEFPLRQAIAGSLNRAARTTRPKRPAEVNWQRTIHANLRHYQPEQQTVIPEKLVGYGRRRATLREVILCVDTSASMATSVVYAGIAASVIASIPSIATRVVMFDTNIVDLTDQAADPVGLLFGVRLGGGTNIDRALAYCQNAITRPRDTILILITDLFEGANKDQLLRRVSTIVDDGVRMITLLALNDQGAPRYNTGMAEQFAERGVPVFACTPDQFAEVMAAAMSGKELAGFVPR